jgi:hypothetical protein
VLRERLQALTGVALEEIPGASLDGELPLTEAVLDRLIARALPPTAPVSDVHVEILDDDAFAVHLSLRGVRLLPRITVAAAILQQPDLPRSPLLVLRWSVPSLGPLARLASPLLSLFTQMPAGIRVEGDRVAIEIGELLRARGLGELLPLLTRLHVTTRRGTARVAFSART